MKPKKFRKVVKYNENDGIEDDTLMIIFIFLGFIYWIFLVFALIKLAYDNLVLITFVSIFFIIIVLSIINKIMKREVYYMEVKDVRKIN